MTDSVDVVEASRNAGAIETAVQDWIDNTTFTSVDHTDIIRRGSNKVLAVIYYTA